MKSLTVETVKEFLNYDPEAGVFTWLKDRPKRKAGSVAGSVGSRGYIRISLFEKSYPAHRLAWLVTHGSFPSKFIDHRNGNKLDNRLSNLREASMAENLRNVGKYRTNSSGFKGVHLRKGTGKWRAVIKCDRVGKNLGVFNTPEEAHQAYCEAAKILHKEFARTK